MWRLIVAHNSSMWRADVFTGKSPIHIKQQTNKLKIKGKKPSNACSYLMNLVRYTCIQILSLSLIGCVLWCWVNSLISVVILLSLCKATAREVPIPHGCRSMACTQVWQLRKCATPYDRSWNVFCALSLSFPPPSGSKSYLVIWKVNVYLFQDLAKDRRDCVHVLVSCLTPENECLQTDDSSDVNWAEVVINPGLILMGFLRILPGRSPRFPLTPIVKEQKSLTKYIYLMVLDQGPCLCWCLARDAPVKTVAWLCKTWRGLCSSSWRNEDSRSTLNVGEERRSEKDHSGCCFLSHQDLEFW